MLTPDEQDQFNNLMNKSKPLTDEELDGMEERAKKDRDFISQGLSGLISSWCDVVFELADDNKRLVLEIRALKQKQANPVDLSVESGPVLVRAGGASNIVAQIESVQA